ncbi:hypothetical protein Barb6XT_03224 [Bacteroidales bacterium Barb6XT]|nr:hypothetical protein Barb6XT_03224 [Bacteroidales bacterium Barb6XT]
MHNRLCYTVHILNDILKLCRPQAMSMTKSSKPDLRHLKRSLTIRHFLIPPTACSTRMRKPDISLFSFSEHPRVVCLWATGLAFLWLRSPAYVPGSLCLAIKYNTGRKVQRLFVHYFVMNMTVTGLEKPKNTFIGCIKQVILHVMSFYRCNMIFACPDPVDALRVFPCRQAGYLCIVPSNILPLNDSCRAICLKFSMSCTGYQTKGKPGHCIGVETYYRRLHDIPAGDYSLNTKEQITVCLQSGGFYLFYDYRLSAL